MGWSEVKEPTKANTMRKFLPGIIASILALLIASFTKKVGVYYKFIGDTESSLAIPIYWAIGLPYYDCGEDGVACYVVADVYQLIDFRELIDTYQPTSVADVENIPGISVIAQRALPE